MTPDALNHLTGLLEQAHPSLIEFDRRATAGDWRDLTERAKASLHRKGVHHISTIALRTEIAFVCDEMMLQRRRRA